MYLHDCETGRACRVEREDQHGNLHSICTKRFPKPYSESTVLSSVKYTDYTRFPPDDDIDSFDPRDEDVKLYIDYSYKF